MAVATVGKARGSAYVRGKLYTPAKAKVQRQRVGRISGLMMAIAGVGVGIFLAPSAIVPLSLMAFLVLVSGFVMDETSNAGWLILRLLGPLMGIAGFAVVVAAMMAGLL